MAPRYQSPPTWPPPPPGWTPPPGWAPDPAWGPAPEGWQFWVEEQPARPNRGAWGWALLSSFGWWLLLILVLVVSSGGGFDAESAGRLLSSFLLGGLVTALVAFLMRARWPVWLYPLAVIPPVFGFLLLTSLGRLAEA